MERRSFLRGGLAVGAATVGLTIASSVTLTEVAKAATTQNNWYWCNLCASLFHSNTAQPDGSCVPSLFNQHSVGSPTEYEVDYDSVDNGFQSQWAWCNNCQVLFYGPDIATSGCAWAYVTRQQNARYYPHHAGSPTNYALALNTVPGDGRTYQGGWNYCPACRNIYHGSGKPAGYCVNTGSKHTPGATPYWMLEV